MLRLWTSRALGHGGVLWEAAIILAATAGETLGSRLTTSARVLEIGAGIGLPGIVVASQYPTATVVLTDVPKLLPLLEYNAALSGLQNVIVASLPFGSSLRKLPLLARPPFDVVLASDVLGCGDAGNHYLLVKTLRDVFHQNPHAALLMSYRPRALFEEAFFNAAMEEGWCVATVREVTADAARQLREAALSVEWRHGSAGQLDDVVESVGGGADDSPTPASVFVLLITAGTATTHSNGSVQPAPQ